VASAAVRLLRRPELRPFGQHRRTIWSSGRHALQVKLGVYELGWQFGYGDGTNGTPAPYFDNVRVKVYPTAGPRIAATEYRLANDGFPAIGDIDLANLGANSVRFDMAPTSRRGRTCATTRATRSGSTRHRVPAARWTARDALDVRASAIRSSIPIARCRRARSRARDPHAAGAVVEPLQLRPAGHRHDLPRRPAALLLRGHGPRAGDGVGNGLGGRATVAQLAGYTDLMYTAGDQGAYTLSNGDFNGDPSQDLQLLNSWLALGNRDMLLCGEDLALSLYTSGTVARTFLESTMGVQYVDGDVRDNIGGQVSPTVVDVAGQSRVPDGERVAAPRRLPDAQRLRRHPAATGRPNAGAVHGCRRGRDAVPVRGGGAPYRRGRAA
jgi:hypothetical protein